MEGKIADLRQVELSEISNLVKNGHFGTRVDGDLALVVLKRVSGCKHVLLLHVWLAPFFFLVISR